MVFDQYLHYLEGVFVVAYEVESIVAPPSLDVWICARPEMPTE